MQIESWDSITFRYFSVDVLGGALITTPEHMPASHRAHLEWTPQKLIDWGLRIGVSTAAEVPVVGDS